MVTIAKIKIWGIDVGVIMWQPDRMYATIEFNSEFSKMGLDLSPIVMPLDEIRNGNRIFSFPGLSRETFNGLPGLIADSLPDRFGNILLDKWLAEQGRTSQSVNPVERLCYMGSRGMGALEYEPAIELSNSEVAERLEVEHLVEVAKMVLNEKTGFKSEISSSSSSGLADIIKIGTSAGGARAKAVLAYNETTGEIRSGQVSAPAGFGYWIIKFDGINSTLTNDALNYGRLEYAYHLMAKDSGIEMMECKLLEENNRAHFMTKRYDRGKDNTKYHMQTLCGIAHFDFNDPVSYAYEDAFRVMRLLRLPYTDAEQLYLRMVFNVISRNQDDHTKNISFLMNKQGNWKLSPAYDINYAYNPENRWLFQHQMSINGKRDNINRSDLLNVATNMNIKKANDIINEVIESVSKWHVFATKAGIPDIQISEIGKTMLLSI